MHNVSSGRLLLALVIVTGLAAAQEPQLLRDINRRGEVPGVEYGLAAVNGRLVFRGDTAATGSELFTATAPTYAVALLRDIHPGPSGCEPEHLTPAGGKLFFFADDGTHGTELWVTDGTTAGTAMVADIRPGPNPSVVVDSYARRPLAVAGGSVYFVANDGVRGAELWKSDGTAAGTTLVVDLAQGPDSPLIAEVAGVGTRVYFNSSWGGGQLWLTDGTAAGTTALGSFYAAPYSFVAVGATLFFAAAATTTEGYEVWKSDGTPAGTTLVRDIFPGQWNSSYPGGFTPFGNRLFFDADDGTHGREPWISDGTAAGTVMLRDVAPGTANSMSGSYRQQWLALGSRVVFAADDGASGQEPWVTDGTAAGTVQLRDVRPGPASSLALGAFDLWRPGQAEGGRGWFGADDGVVGAEPWTTDGTVAGTQRVADLVPGATGSRPLRTVTAGANAAFLLADSTASGALWRMDPTSASLVTPVAARAPRQTWGSSPRDFTALGGHLLFAAEDEVNGNELWCTDGTPAGTALVHDIRPGIGFGFETGDPEYYAAGAMSAARLGNHLYFAAYGAQQAFGLWRSDGTAAGTTLVRPLDRTAGSMGYVIHGTSYRDLLFFTAWATNLGWSLWVTDGTAVNTVRLHSSGAGLPRNGSVVARLGKRAVWFSATMTSAIVVSSVDVTNGARSVIANVPSGYQLGIQTWLRLGNRMLFVVPLSNTDSALWVTDGVAATNLIPSLGAGAWGRRQLVRFQDRVYFMGGDATAGVELWRTDGTPAGTARFADLAPGAASSSPRSFAVAGDRMFFGADDGSNVALWSTDGSTAGTARVLSIPGSWAPPDIQSTTAVGSRRVFFSVLAGAVTGSELWTSDGTAAGTRLLRDLWPGPSGPAPRSLTAHRGRLVFAAEDAWRGQEPWVVTPGASAMPYGVGCAASGYEPELTATDPVLGATLTFAVGGAIANAAGVALFGAPSVPELQLGLGCAFAVVTTGSVGVPFATDGSGRFASPPLAVPNDLALVGAQLALQTAVGPTANLPLPIDLSNGMLLTFGR